MLKMGKFHLQKQKNDRVRTKNDVCICKLFEKTLCLAREFKALRGGVERFF